MQYLSTRDSALRVSAQEAIVRGLAPQSGLFVPETFPQADLDAWKNLSYPELAEKVLAGFLTDYSADFLHTATASTYGAAFGGNCRGFLRQMSRSFRKLGLTCNVGAECEFYLFETDEHGNPTRIPLDIGGYFDIPPLDKGENIRREICFAIEEMGLHPEHSHHESGHGQNEVCFRYTTALKSADNLNTFKSTVKAIAARNGLFASFMPKPLANLHKMLHE